MQDAFGIVLFVVVGVGFVVALISLFGRGRMYDQIGRGGLSIGEDRDLRPNPPEQAPISKAEREDEIRQMLEARNARRATRGLEPVDVEAELASLVAPKMDAELVGEIRDLVEARNRRRVKRGEEPLDVEAEVARQVAEFGSS